MEYSRVARVREKEERVLEDRRRRGAANYARLVRRAKEKEIARVQNTRRTTAARTVASRPTGCTEMAEPKMYTRLNTCTRLYTR